MRILQVIPYFSWSHGGPVRIVYELSEKLAKMGHSVTIYSTDAGDSRSIQKESELMAPANVNLRLFRTDNGLLAKRMRIHLSSEMYIAMKSDLRNYDVIHLHEWRGVPNWYVWHLAAKLGKPYILQAHGSSPLILGNQSVSRTISKVLYDLTIGRNVARHASRFIALTQDEIAQYAALGVDGEKIELLPNGLDLQDYVTLPTRGSFRRKYHVGENDKLVLYLGRVSGIKGIDLLVRAFSEILSIRRQGDYRLIIVGPDDGYLDRLMTLMKTLDLGSTVSYVGPLYGKERISAYVDSDVYVLPSMYETFPVTVLEALACGTPVVVTDRCGIADEIRNSGGLVVGYDQGQLREAILKLLDDIELSKRLGLEGKEMVMKKYDWNLIAGQMEQVYLKAICSRELTPTS